MANKVLLILFLIGNLNLYSKQIFSDGCIVLQLSNSEEDGLYKMKIINRSNKPIYINNEAKCYNISGVVNLNIGMSSKSFLGLQLGMNPLLSKIDKNDSIVITTLSIDATLNSIIIDYLVDCKVKKIKNDNLYTISDRLYYEKCVQYCLFKW